jgi:hypothetical protein
MCHAVAGLQESAQFVDHTWLADGRLVVASSDQKVMLLEGVQVQYTITLQRSPTCLLALPDGLLAVAMSRVSELWDWEGAWLMAKLMAS